MVSRYCLIGTDRSKKLNRILKYSTEVHRNLLKYFFTGSVRPRGRKSWRMSVRRGLPSQGAPAEEAEGCLHRKQDQVVPAGNAKGDSDFTVYDSGWQRHGEQT
jgi:hypothetical protein